MNLVHLVLAAAIGGTASIIIALTILYLAGRNAAREEAEHAGDLVLDPQQFERLKAWLTDENNWQTDHRTGHYL